MKRHMKVNTCTRILLGGALIVVGAVFLGGIEGANEEVRALTYEDTADVQFTFNPTISVSLDSSALAISNLTPGSSADSNIVTATVSTNAGSGFYVKAATGSSKLTHTSNSSYYFDSLASAVTSLANIPEGRWGYTYSTNGGTTWANYAALPVGENNAATILSQTSYAGSGSVKLKIGAKAAAVQPSGTYNGTVNFYAVVR